MNQSISGALALAIFAILLFLFISAITATPSLTPAASRNSGNTPSTLPANNQLRVATATPATGTAAVNAAGNAAAASNLVPAAGQTLYTVQSGEWLQAIANRYSTTVDAIVAINPQISDPGAILPGQQILIPSTRAP